jgi:hypothetical protein
MKCETVNYSALCLCFVVQVVMRGSNLSMLSATESPQAPVAFAFPSTPPAVNTLASDFGTSPASSSITTQGIRRHSNQQERLNKRGSVSGNVHRQHFFESQAVLGSGYPIYGR